MSIKPRARGDTRLPVRLAYRCYPVLCTGCAVVVKNRRYRTVSGLRRGWRRALDSVAFILGNELLVTERPSFYKLLPLHPLEHFREADCATKRRQVGISFEHNKILVAIFGCSAQGLKRFLH